MGRRGPAPQYAKREALERLLNDGLSLSEAARRVGVNRKTAKRWRNGRVIRYPGGRAVHYPPVINAPTVKTYSTRYLGEGERVRLADLRREGRTIRSIATLMGRAPSTISRELRRGADSLGRYRPHEAHQRALARRRLDRPSRLARDRQLREWVESKLKRRWSPEQVSRGLRQQFPHQPHRWLCAETIYQAVYRPDLGGLSRELPGRILRHRRRYRLRRRDAQHRRSAPVTGMVSVHERPDTVADRREPGHWEGDLIKGSGNKSAVAVLVERVSRAVMLAKMPDASAASALQAFTDKLQSLQEPLRQTLTYDQGREMSRHAELTEATGVRVYFCDPHSPWQRGTCENTNGLLRQYLPKGTDLSVYSQEELDAIADSLNTRPRQTLGWMTPLQILAQVLANPRQTAAVH